MNTVNKGLFASVALLIMVSCGGGGSDVAGGGIGGTGVSQGPITGFGSVFVNGIEFHTTGAEIEIEDSPQQPESELRTGMVVKIEWEKDSSGTNYTARRIVYSDDVQGPVSSLNAVTNTFTVLGRTVTVTSLTVFDGGLTGFAGITDGQVVEVSGLIDANGNIQATRIELKDPSVSEFEIKGIVSGFVSLEEPFNVAGVAVNYIGDISPITGLIDGACVEGKLSSVVPSSPLSLTEITLDDSCTAGGSEGGEVQIEGLIADFTVGTNPFTVNGQAVRVTPQTLYGNDSSSMLGNDVKIEVEGTLSSGVLVAKKISFRQEATGDIEGIVTNVGTANKTVTLDAGTVTVNNLTLFDDDLRNLGDIRMGDKLKIHYYTQGSSTKIATHIEKE